MDTKKLDELVEQYQAARSFAKEAKDEQDRLAGLIKAEMGENEVYYSPSGKVTYAPVTSHPLDATRLKAERPEVAEAYTMTRTTRPLKVS